MNKFVVGGGTKTADVMMGTERLLQAGVGDWRKAGHSLLHFTLEV
ncbi:MAG: hypothetical protein QME62_01290 [Armatimonadota bacterium]|nr:hypothetical protein [Armatimonadota bacterium]